HLASLKSVTADGAQPHLCAGVDEPPTATIGPSLVRTAQARLAHGEVERRFPWLTVYGCWLAVFTRGGPWPQGCREVTERSPLPVARKQCSVTSQPSNLGLSRNNGSDPLELLATGGRDARSQLPRCAG
ncbi:unnamed protein product, partial [Urochloa humidicola]